MNTTPQLVQKYISLSFKIFLLNHNIPSYIIYCFYIFILYMMTLIVDKYYRRIIQNIDNIRMKFDISSLLVKSKEHDSKIENDETNISSNLIKIGNNETNIANNLSKINTIEKISDEVFNDKYNIINQSFNFNKNTHSYQLFEKVIENNMTTGELIINTIINYKYDNLENDINRLTHMNFLIIKMFYFTQLH